MAGNGGGDGFGDFEFAPSSSYSISGLGFSSTNDIRDSDDDDWGDFVKSGVQFGTGSVSSQKLDPFSLSSSGVQLDSAPKRADSAEIGGVKPNRAIPLSIFGEEEDDSGAVEDSSFTGTNGLFLSPAKVDNVQKDQPDLNDLIFNFYKPSMESSNGSLPKSALSESASDPQTLGILDTNKTSLNSNGFINGKHEVSFSSNGFPFMWNGLNVASNGLNSYTNGSKETNMTPNLLTGVNLSSIGFAPMQNGFKLDSNGINPSAGDVEVVVVEDVDDDDEDDDDGWEFKVAESKIESGSEISKLKIEENKAQNGSILNLNEDASGLNSNVNGVQVNLVGKSQESSDDDDWEFKTAGSETSSRDDSLKVDGNVQEHPKVPESAFGFGNVTNGPTNFFAPESGISGSSNSWGFNMDFHPSSASEKKEDDKNNGFTSSALNENIDSDESWWTFKDASSGAVSKNKEEPKTADSFAMDDFSFDDKVTRNTRELEKQKGALPLSVFGDMESETDDALAFPGVSTHMPASSKVDLNGPASNVSIKDLLSTLYGQAEQNGSVNPRDSPNENGSTQQQMEPDLVDDDDGFEDDSWEFKGALSVSGDGNQKSGLGVQDSSNLYSTKAGINDYEDFYSKLKDELCFVALSHLDRLKKVQSSALSVEDADIEGLEKEIQGLTDFVRKDDSTIKGIPSENIPSRSISLNDFTKILLEEKFQVLDLQYHLSEKLSLAEKDLKSATALLKHVASTLKTLKLGTIKEQCMYVSAWFQIASACARELKHGSFIWKQSLDKGIHTQLLTNPQGRQYIHALGEIYGVIEIIGLSAKIFTPWILFRSENSTGLFNLLRECSTLWSNSGLYEACQRMSHSAESNSGPIKALIDSIEDIQSINTHELCDRILSGDEPTCRLSLLTARTIPGMKMITWNGEHYLLKLGNLWANLISPDPPNLPRIFARSSC